MKKSDFWILSLAAFMIMGISLHWILPIRILVILNSLLVLFNVARDVWRLAHHG
jgi:hypothetical protein